MIENICNKLNLGNLIRFEEIKGGITNKMYKAITDKGEYALKILNTTKSNNIDELLDKIENSEIIANIAIDNYINAVAAIEFNNKYIQKIDDFYVLVYNWIDGSIKLSKEITLSDVKKVAHEQALLHAINIDNYKTNKMIFRQIHCNFDKYYNLLKDKDEDYLKMFKEKYNEFIKIYEKVYNNYLELDDKLVFTHKDLNRKNILWNSDVPYIIDWETALISDPSIDFFNSIWFLSNDVEETKFYEYAKEYLSIMNINISNGVYAGIIEECNWLYFSLERLFSNDENEINLGIDSIETSLIEIFNYYEKIPKMLNLLSSITKSH